MFGVEKDYNLLKYSHILLSLLFIVIIIIIYMIKILY